MFKGIFKIYSTVKITIAFQLRREEEKRSGRDGGRERENILGSRGDWAPTQRFNQPGSGTVVTTWGPGDSLWRLQQWEVLTAAFLAVDQDPRGGRACPEAHSLWIDSKVGPVSRKARPCHLWCTWTCQSSQGDLPEAQEGGPERLTGLRWGSHCLLQGFKTAFLWPHSFKQTRALGNFRQQPSHCKPWASFWALSH